MNLLEFAASGGTVTLLGQPLKERFIPRQQIRYGFTGLKAAHALVEGKAVARSSAKQPMQNRKGTRTPFKVYKRAVKA